ncbi:PWWP domain-containing DNA repair factor 3B-like isoform X2 [Scyliorhinus torazame]|uniref:PWWP domain-containing DNA repair factor 3B-like isoform X2 n=1 Tax=Scyliorhinus torazame TaxID=75743 RepID=UPI003B59D7BA
MTDLDEFIFCNWQGRLWPAKILSESAVYLTKTSESVSDCLDVQLICLDKQLRVKHIDTRPFERKQAENISSGLIHKEDSTHEEAVEELTYRKALRIALNILTSHDCRTTQMTLKEPEMAKTQTLASKKLRKSSCVHNSNGTTSTPKQNGFYLLRGQETVCTRQSSRIASCIKKTPEAERGKKPSRTCTLTQSSTKTKKPAGKEEKRKVGRPRKNLEPQADSPNDSLSQCEHSLRRVKQTAAEAQGYRGEERLQEVERSPFQRCDSAISAGRKDQNGNVKKIHLRSRIICKSACKEIINSSDQANCPSQDIGPPDAPSSFLKSTLKCRTSDNIGLRECSQFVGSPSNVQLELKGGLGQSEMVEEHRRRKGRKCTEPMECLHTNTTSADLDIDVKSTNQPNVGSLEETRSPRHVKGSVVRLPPDEQVRSTNGHKRSISDNPQTFCPTNTPLNKPEAFPPSKIRKDEGASEIQTLSTAEPETHLELPLFEIDEIEFSSVDSLSTNKPTEDEGEEVDEENDDEDENLPSILLHQEQWSVAEGMLVWCKFQKYPHWPAVVRNVKSRLKKASILFVDEHIIDAEKNKKGFTVSVRTLKPFDCENRHQLTAAARHIYKTSIDWCVALIDDYRIRRGCGSFTGSFVEYCTAELSIPVRKSFAQDPSLMTFPYTSIANQVEEGLTDSEYDITPTRQQPTKKLLPDRKKAARDRANEKLVQFIVKARGAERHLQAIIKGLKHSRWLEVFQTRIRNSSVIDTYLEDDWQVDQVVNYLKTVCEMSVSTKLLEDYERSRFILDVLLPEAIICAIAEVEQMSVQKAEEKYMKGPLHSEREVEHFNKEIEKEMKLKQKLLKKEESTD